MAITFLALKIRRKDNGVMCLNMRSVKLQEHLGIKTTSSPTYTFSICQSLNKPETFFSNSTNLFRPNSFHFYFHNRNPLKMISPDIDTYMILERLDMISNSHKSLHTKSCGKFNPFCFTIHSIIFPLFFTSSDNVNVISSFNCWGYYRGPY